MVALSLECETCRTCESSGSCGSSGLSFLESLPDTPLLQRERQRVTLFVSTVTSMPRAGRGAGQLDQCQEHAKRVVGLTKPVATMALKLLKSGWFDFARREMLQGRNPGRNAWQRIFCDALMRGGLPRQALMLCFQEQMSLTPGSAKVRTSHAVSVFVTGGLVIESQGLLQLRRN